MTSFLNHIEGKGTTGTLPSHPLAETLTSPEWFGIFCDYDFLKQNQEQEKMQTKLNVILLIIQEKAI